MVATPVCCALNGAGHHINSWPTGDVFDQCASKASGLVTGWDGHAWAACMARNGFTPPGAPDPNFDVTAAPSGGAP